MNKKNLISLLIDNTKTILFALAIAIIIRSLIFQPFYIPSSSMEPTLLIGDRIFVSKYTYGFSKHSFPFSPHLFSQRIYYQKPKLGDPIVFKTPVDNRTDYIKRLIGLPGDEIQFVDGEIFLNNEKITRNKIEENNLIRCGKISFEVNTYEETLPNGKKYIAVYSKDGSMINSDEYIVPENHYFFMGDNRDCSQDSRFLSSVGYVNFDNLVGKARVVFFSSNKKEGTLFEFWKWNRSVRINRFFMKIK